MTISGSNRFGRGVLSLALLATLALPMQTGAQPSPVAKALAPPADTGGWAALTPVQRTALAPLKSEWSSLDSTRQQKWLEVASRFPSMSADERARVQVRMSDWVKMSPAERGRARQQFQEARQLSPEDRQARWQAYQALPPAQRNALAARNGVDAAKPARPATAATPASAPKRNLVTPEPAATPTKPVGPTVVQAKPGVSTTLMSQPAAPPVHHQPGLPKINATKGFVDPATLLPKRGPQGAAIAAAPSTAASQRP
ncbi:MAG TPA: DUF3106 domain-containing protein [Rubrivivax sp.]